MLLWNAYKDYVHSTIMPDSKSQVKDIEYWRDELFGHILTYIVPVGLIAIIPGIYLSFRQGLLVLAISDLLVFAGLVSLMLIRGIKVKTRKFIFFCILYYISVVLLYYVSKPGIGMLYMLGITVLASIIDSSAAACYAVFINVVICIVFAVLIYMGLGLPIALDYSGGVWLVISSNLIVCSIICALMVNFLLSRLKATLDDKNLSEVNLILNGEKLARAQQIARMGGWELNFDTNQFKLSLEAGRIFSYNSGQNTLSFQEWSALIHPQDISFVLQSITESRQSQKGSSFNHRIVLEDGTVKHVHSESKFEFSPEGDPIGLYGTLQDITEKKLAEEKQDFDSNNLAALINNTRDLMWSVDRDFNLITSNYAFDELVKAKGFGTGSDGLSGLYSEEQVLRYKGFYSRAFAGETFSEHEYTSEPYEAWSEVSFYPIRMGDAIIGTACHAHDVTGSRRAQKRIVELSEKFEAASEQRAIILNTLPANIALLDGTGNIIEVNQTWAQFADTIYSQIWKSSTGDNYIALCKKEGVKGNSYAGRMAIALENILKGELNEFAVEYSCHTPAEQKWFRAEVRSLLHQGGLPGAVVMHIDITGLKLAELALTEINNKLDERVNERTAELSEANVALEAFSYSVSHDLRSPVRSVMGFARIIGRDYGAQMNDDMKELFDHIEKSSRRMSAIIDDLLRLAKSGKEKLMPVEVNITALFNSVWRDIKLTSQTNATFLLADLPFVTADISMLQQVIVNLLSNAVKYSSKTEKPVIQVGYKRIDSKIVFSITDNGAGFDMKFYDQLFGAFQRLHGVNEFEGTGVGLLMVKRIIERHGGTVWAEGKVGEGATFYFTLPGKI
jgi:signal transduction histidine kinase